MANSAKFSSKFNLGNSIYQQGRYEESMEFFDASTGKTTDKVQLSHALYNKGNALFEQQQYYKAADAYKEAIRTNPSNKNAQYNLAMTKEVIKQIEQQQQEQQEQQNQENQENQDQDQEQQNEEQQSGESEQENEEEQDQQSEQQDSTIQNQNNFDSTRLEKQTLDSLDAAKLLQIIQSEEQKVQEKMRKYNSNRKKQDKDW